MTLEEAIFYKLSHDANITALVGSRIYPVKMPDNPTFPAISFQSIFVERMHAMTGAVNGTTRAQVQIDSRATTPAAARTIAKKVHNALNGFSGTIDSLVVGSCLSISEQSFFEDEIDVHRQMQEYEFYFTEQE